MRAWIALIDESRPYLTADLVNMAAGLDLPKVPMSERRALNPDEFASLANAARGSRLYAAIVMLLATGMRRGELLALRWRDVDFTNGRLAVRRSLESSEAGLHLKAPKTARVRVITLPAIAVSGSLCSRSIVALRSPRPCDRARLLKNRSPRLAGQSWRAAP